MTDFGTGFDVLLCDRGSVDSRRARFLVVVACETDPDWNFSDSAHDVLALCNWLVRFASHVRNSACPRPHAIRYELVGAEPAVQRMVRAVIDKCRAVQSPAA